MACRDAKTKNACSLSVHPGDKHENPERRPLQRTFGIFLVVPLKPDVRFLHGAGNLSWRGVPQVGITHYVISGLSDAVMAQVITVRCLLHVHALFMRNEQHHRTKQIVTHRMISASMERIILSVPVSGATVPPSRKGKDLRSAEAAPWFFAIAPSARVTANVVIIPTQNNISINVMSQTRNFAPVQSSTSASIPVGKIPSVLHLSAAARFLIFIITVLQNTSQES